MVFKLPSCSCSPCPHLFVRHSHVYLLNQATQSHECQRASNAFTTFLELTRNFDVFPPLMNIYEHFWTHLWFLTLRSFQIMFTRILFMPHNFRYVSSIALYRAASHPVSQGALNTLSVSSLDHIPGYISRKRSTKAYSFAILSTIVTCNTTNSKDDTALALAGRVAPPVELLW